MTRSSKPLGPNGTSADVEARALADLLVPPSPLEQLAEWRTKVAARLSKASGSPKAPASRARPKKGG